MLEINMSKRSLLAYSGLDNTYSNGAMLWWEIMSFALFELLLQL